MAARSLWRAKPKLLFAVTAAGGAGAGAVAIANSGDPASALKLSTAVPIRLLRDAFTAATIAFGRMSFSSLSISGCKEKEGPCLFADHTGFCSFLLK